MKRRFLMIPALAAVVLGAGAAYAVATGDDDATGRPVTGAALERAGAIALDHVGGGRVTGSEAGDEQGAYEIEVTRSDGSQVDVHLDASFQVLGTEDDGAGEDD